MIVLQCKAKWMYNKICSGLIAVAVLVTCSINCRAQETISGPEQVGTGGGEVNFKPKYDEDAFTWYGAYTKDNNLYIRITIQDSLQKRKVLQNGMEVWIDVKGRKNKETGIMFPLGEKANIYPGGGNRNAAGGPPPFLNFSEKGSKNEDSAIRQLVSTKKDVVLKGFAGGGSDTQNIAALTGTRVILAIAHDTLVYDAVVPFASLKRQPAANSTVSIGIVEKGVDLPGFGGPMDGGPGSDDIGGGGPPPGGGMMPPGEDNDGGFDFKRLFQINVTWVKVKLHS